MNKYIRKQIKLSGACGLSSALTCALVTVTTTVIHMSRLQALRECEYTRKTRTCTCYSIETHAMQDENGNIGGNDESEWFSLYLLCSLYVVAFLDLYL